MTLCSAEAGTRLFAGIKHKTLEYLKLSKINLTTAAAESLGQSLPELSALRRLEISGVTFCSAEAGTRLFAGIKHKTLEDLKLMKSTSRLQQPSRSVNRCLNYQLYKH